MRNVDGPGLGKSKLEATCIGIFGSETVREDWLQRRIHGKRHAASVDSRRIGRIRHTVAWRLRRPFALSNVSIRRADSAPQFDFGLPEDAGRR
ncbi:hypothetical protein WS69_20445 [Burkholderia sp. BDU5]|uniref:hypothetical protein n=1 Tax=Burkholderia mayonis TaxID=1385591 RepID=UPI00076DC6F4|nr:hypothetical protein [Burkholderia mayonis]KVE44329.1 hypothetical protein WS69_20445 [Burkholderia sp. BDU5]